MMKRYTQVSRIFQKVRKSTKGMRCLMRRSPKHSKRRTKDLTSQRKQSGKRSKNN